MSNRALSPGVRACVLAAARNARAAGQPVPDVPVISPVEAFRRAAGALDRTLAALSEEEWRRPALRDLDVQGLIGHLTGVEDDVRRGIGHDPAVAGAGHVESTQAAAVRQAGQPPSRTLGEWRDAVAATLAVVTGLDDLDRDLAVHGMRLPLGALMLVRAFELWVHENDIRLVTGRPPAAPDPPSLRLMTALAVRLLPGAARQCGLPSAARLRLVLTGQGGGTWDVVLGDDDPAAEPSRLSIVADTVGFCRLAANRIRPAELGAHVTGSQDLAARVLAATATLALD